MEDEGLTVEGWSVAVLGEDRGAVCGDVGERDPSVAGAGGDVGSEGAGTGEE